MDSDLTTHGFFSIHKLCDDYMGGGTRRDEEGDKHDLAQVLSFTKGHTANRTVLSFFYVHSIDEPDKPNVLSLELKLLYLKPKSFSEQLSGKDFCR